MLRRTLAILAPLLLGATTAGCASGSSRTPTDAFPSVDASAPPWEDGSLPDAPPEFDGWVESDLGIPDAASITDSRITFREAGSRDAKPRTDGGGGPCVDPYEPNATCATAKALPPVKESGGWSTGVGGVASPASDVDWFAAPGEEKQHFCVPLTPQCFALQVRMAVPAGRKLRLCVREKVCTASPTCADNASTPGPVELNVEYKVKGTCGGKDDTRALIEVVVLDGKGDCPPYTLSHRYEGC